MPAETAELYREAFSRQFGSLYANREDAVVLDFFGDYNQSVIVVPALNTESNLYSKLDLNGYDELSIRLKTESYDHWYQAILNEQIPVHVDEETV